jgi:hypothetical protein
VIDPGDAEDVLLVWGFLCVTWLPVFALGVYVDFEDANFGLALGPVQVCLGDFRGLEN